MRRAAPLALLGLLAACAQGPGGPEPAPPASDGGGAGDTSADARWFHEVGAAWGLDFVHASGAVPGRHYMPEIMGGGAALVDADRDGRLDVYLVGSGQVEAGGGPRGRNALYLNRPGPDGAPRFELAVGVAADQGYGMGVAQGDANGDGIVDLYVTNWGPDTLWLGDGAGGFVDGTAAAGLGDRGWGTSAAFFDADRDGDLDLYVARYLVWSVAGDIECRNDMGAPDYCSPQSHFSPALDAFFVNRGDGTFEDASVASGIASKPGTGLGVTTGDFDGDGWVDVFVANDGMSDFLWRNRGDGTFEDVALFAGCAIDDSGVPKAGMGVVAQDFDHDGDLDVVVCNLHKQSDSFFENLGGTFRDRTLRAGLATASRLYTRFGLGWIDFDHDGELDLYQANGRVMRQATAPSDDPYAEPNLLLRGLGGARYEPVPDADGGLVATSRAAAFGDLDGDGDVDVVVVNRDGPVHVLENRARKRGGWVAFDVRGTSGAPALGAALEVRAGGRRLFAHCQPAYSYLASNESRVHLGLGALQGVDEVVVTWPDGARERFGPVAAGATHRLERGSGTPLASPSADAARAPRD